MKRIATLALALTLAFPAASFAACSDEDLEKKVDLFQDAVAKAAAKDAQKTNDLVTAMEPDLAKAQAAEDDNDSLCTFYDEAAKKLDF